MDWDRCLPSNRNRKDWTILPRISGPRCANLINPLFAKTCAPGSYAWVWASWSTLVLTLSSTPHLWGHNFNLSFWIVLWIECWLTLPPHTFIAMDVLITNFVLCVQINTEYWSLCDCDQQWNRAYWYTKQYTEIDLKPCSHHLHLLYIYTSYMSWFCSDYKLLACFYNATEDFDDLHSGSCWLFQKINYLLWCSIHELMLSLTSFKLDRFSLVGSCRSASLTFYIHFYVSVRHTVIQKKALLLASNQDNSVLIISFSLMILFPFISCPLYIISVVVFIIFIWWCNISLACANSAYVLICFE